MSARDEMIEVVLPVLEKCFDSDWNMTYSEMVTDALIAAGYRKIFDGDCGLSNVKDPTDREASEAWMRWANLAMNEDVGAIYAMKKMLTELGYRKPRTITTAAEIRELPALTIVVYDDMATGGLLQTYVVPDDGTVMFKDREPFHLMTFAGDYIDSEDMPLPLAAVYEVGP